MRMQVNGSKLIGKRQTRVKILKDTIAKWQDRGEGHGGYRHLARENMARWKSTKTGEAPKTTFTLHVEEMDTLDLTARLTKEYKEMFACLNMAHGYIPGGGYTAGMAAQEENIFRRTNAHFTLDETVMDVDKGKVLYKKRMQELLTGKHGRVYLSDAPLVCFKESEAFKEEDDVDLGYKTLDDDEVFPFYELRSAAVNLRSQYKVANPKREMKKRIEAQLDTLIAAGRQHVVLSAFGCGAFGNDPQMVAEMYRTAISERMHKFRVIGFAIFYAGSGPKNYEIFRKVLGN